MEWRNFRELQGNEGAVGGGSSSDQIVGGRKSRAACSYCTPTICPLNPPSCPFRRYEWRAYCVLGSQVSSEKINDLPLDTQGVVRRGSGTCLQVLLLLESRHHLLRYSTCLPKVLPPFCSQKCSSFPLPSHFSQFETVVNPFLLNKNP